MSSSSNRVLVVGGGPAGATAAFWLGQAGFEVLVVEKATKDFAYGQGIDITGPAVKIVKRMGLEQTIRSNTTEEGGIALLDDNSIEIASLGVNHDKNKNSLSLTQEIEIMRGELSRILANAASEQSNVTYRYGCSVSDYQESEKAVSVRLSDSGEVETFSVVIGADGIGSKVRQMAFDKEVIKDCYKSTNVYSAFFAIPGQKEDVPNARLQQAPYGRSVVIRPINKEGTASSCYVNYVGPSEKLEKALREGLDAQKAAFAETFADFPGLGQRAIESMKDADNFYCTRLAQVKLPTWSSGRCVLVGDAAYCPSPLTGQGTTLAILGSYILAGEMATAPDDPLSAFGRYHTFLKDYVAKSQAIPLGGRAPRVLQPWTSWGIWLFRTLFWIVAKTKVWKVFSLGTNKEFQLPDYEFGHS